MRSRSTMKLQKPSTVAGNGRPLAGRRKPEIRAIAIGKFHEKLPSLVNVNSLRTGKSSCY